MSVSKHSHDPLTPLVEALAGSKSRGIGHTRLATVTTVDASQGGVFVRFDGETAASPRAYRRLGSYTATVGHRVLMIRVGSTWVVVGNITA